MVGTKSRGEPTNWLAAGEHMAGFRSWRAGVEEEMENAVVETTIANASAAQRVARGAMAENVGIWGPIADSFLKTRIIITRTKLRRPG